MASQSARADSARAEHLVLFFPLWLGDMPALLYRWCFRAHSVKSLKRNILGFVGVSPVNETQIGMVEQLGEEGVARWLKRMRKFGSQAR